jgi:hypothetical protein
MSTARRIFVTIGAPLVVVVGLAAAWGYRNGVVVKNQVEVWADALEHSPDPVTMHLAELPVVPRPFFVDGERVGDLDVVVVQREAAGTVDGLLLQVRTRARADLDALEGCNLHFDPDVIDHEGLSGFTRALACVSDVSELVEFGRVTLEGTGLDLGLYLDKGDLPCDHMGDHGAEACREVRREIRRIRAEVGEKVRIRF